MKTISRIQSLGIGAGLGAIVVAGIFLFAIHFTRAQTQPTTANDYCLQLGGCPVYLPLPTVNASLHGQFMVQVNISGVPDTMVNHLYLRAYQGAESSSQLLGQVPCQMSQANLNYWTGWCDTMTFGNASNVYLQPHATDYMGNELYLRVSTGQNLLGAESNPKFGPFTFSNTYFFVNPQSNTTLGGAIAFHAGLSGDASSARVDVYPSGSSTVVSSIQLIKDTSGSEEQDHAGTEWFSTQWDTQSFANGGYTAYLTFVSRYDTAVVRSRVAQVQFLIQNSTSTQCDTENAWACSDWSVCSSAGTQSRTCTLRSGCPTTIPSPALTQTCTPPATNTNSGTSPTNSSTTTNTNTSSTTTTQLQAPTITDPVSGSQHRNTLFAVRGNASPGVRVRIVVDGSRVDGEATAGTDGRYSYLIQTPLSPGQHQVMTIAVGNNNLTSPPSNIVTLTMLPPDVLLVSPEAGQTVFGRSQRLLSTVTYDGEITGFRYLLHQDGVSTDKFIGSGHPLATNPKSWEYSWDTTQTANGKYYVIAQVQIKTGQWYRSSAVPVTVKQDVTPTEAENIDSSASANLAEIEQALDTDSDGLTDDYEAQIGIDSHNSDTDGDGVTDGEEVRLGTNPLGADANADVSAKITSAIKDSVVQMAFEEPTQSGTLAPTTLQVKTVENYSPTTGTNQLVISGIGPPNTYVTIYVYSTPIVVTTKTDESGNFTYTLDSNLVDGKHEVYVTVNDETGKIQEKSSPLTIFVRKARAVTETEYLRGDVNVTTPGTTSMSRYIIIALSVVAVVVILLLGIRYIIKKPNV